MKTILIADEDANVKEFVSLMFPGYVGYRVVAVSSGVDAISKAKEIKPDIIFADVSLSDKNGYEVSREIKNDPLLKNTYVILFTASLGTFDETQATESYADDFIIKPFKSKEITKKVEALISHNEKREIPSVNLMLVLLVIFMVMVPILYQNLPKVKSKLTRFSNSLSSETNVNLPKVELKPTPTAEREKKIVITVNDRREILIENKKYTLSELKFEIPNLIKSHGKEVEDEVIFLRADADIPYGIVIEVMAEIKRAGVKKVELVTEPVLAFKSGQPDGKYTVQIGAFQKEEKAKKIVENLVSKGYPAFVKTVETPEKGTWHMMRIGTFKTREEAKLYGDNLKNREPLIKEVTVLETEKEKKKEPTFEEVRNRLIKEMQVIKTIKDIQSGEREILQKINQ